MNSPVPSVFAMNLAQFVEFNLIQNNFASRNHGQTYRAQKESFVSNGIKTISFRYLPVLSNRIHRPMDVLQFIVKLN